MSQIAALALVLGLATQITTDHATQPAAGYWKGAITLPATELAIQIELGQTNTGWQGSIDIPVQGLRGFQLGEVKIEGSAVSFTLPNIPGSPSFEGNIANADTIKGIFSQAGQDFPFHLARYDGEAREGETPSRGVKGEGLAGAWQGSLTANGFQLRIVFKIEDSPDGLTGTMDSLDQNALNIPIKSASLEGQQVRLGVAAVGGTYEGSLSEDGSSIDGQWKQGTTTLPLNLKRLAKAPSTRRPQDPTEPYPYHAEDVTFPNEKAGIQLAGTLTHPQGEGPFPAAVLISGSGPQDRNEALMGHRPFLVLADHLTRNGIAVLRYDDRGVGKSEGKFSKALVSDFTTDALSAFAYLKTRKEIDGKRIGLIGHSEGGVVAPQAAVISTDIAYIVMLAGVGVPLEDLLRRQQRDLLRVVGADEKSVAKQQGIQKQIFEIARSDTDKKQARKQILKILETVVEELTPEQLEAIGYDGSSLESQASMVLSPWFRNLLTIDPRPTLEQVRCPVLALNGEKDVQVAFEENLAAIERAVKKGGNQDVTVRAFPNLNHLFQECETGALAEYSLINETFNETALSAISKWVRSKTGLTND